MVDRERLAERLSDQFAFRPERARWLAFEVAQLGLQVLPAEAEGAGRSCFGGAGILPADEVWPRDASQAPLTFLAVLHLGEIRQAGGDPRLPGQGTLLFFADLETEPPDGFFDTAPNTCGSPARVRHVPDGAELVSVKPADSPIQRGHRLQKRKVRFKPALTLDASPRASERLQLDPTEQQVYREALGALMPETAHWVGGLIRDAQGHRPADGDSVLLLHLSYDHELNFVFHDAGTIQFRISESELADRQWQAITAEPQFS